jgi:hypothetical protein
MELFILLSLCLTIAHEERLFSSTQDSMRILKHSFKM